MPISDPQLEANRRNALNSTGPRTPEGKEISRLNALKHGILTRKAVIDHGTFHESHDDFQALLDQLRDQLDPHGPLEDLLVQQIAVCYWRLRRTLQADSREFGQTLERVSGPPETIEYLDQVITRQIAAFPESKRLDTIMRYEKAIQSQLDRALYHLDRLQHARRRRPAPNTDNLRLSNSS